MPELAKKSDCTGCTACVAVCPAQCLKMVADKSGFRYPELYEKDKCLSCNKCEKVCSVLHKESKESTNEFYAAFSKNEEIRKESSSGGIFSEIALKILERNGCIYGAAYMQDGEVKHICVENSKQLRQIRGAKYAQSDVEDLFGEIKQKLNLGTLVLFSGVPCQVEGLKAFLGKEYDNLISIDFVCHGVPAPKVWTNYVKWKSNIENAGKLPRNINLRDKSTGWSNYRYSTVFEYDEKKSSCINSQNLFMKLFVEDYINRESCSVCKFKGIDRISDITLGDFWGIWDVIPEMDDDKGTSLVMINSDKGKEIWDLICDDIIKKEVNFEDAVKQNPSLISSSHMKENRNEILNKAINMEFEYLNKYFFEKVERSLLDKIKDKTKLILKNVMGNC